MRELVHVLRAVSKTLCERMMILCQRKMTWKTKKRAMVCVARNSSEINLPARRKERTLWIIPSTGIINSKKMLVEITKVCKKIRISNKFLKIWPRKMRNTTMRTWLIACLTKDLRKKCCLTLLYYIIANKWQVSVRLLHKYIKQRDSHLIAPRLIKFPALGVPSGWTLAWTPRVEEVVHKTFIQRFNKEEWICNQINHFH